MLSLILGGGIFVANFLEIAAVCGTTAFIADKYFENK